MTILAVILMILSLPLWLGMVANLATMKDSDPAGNALSHAFGFIMMMIAWVFFAAILILTALIASPPLWVAGAELLFLPLSGLAAIIIAGSIYADRGNSPVRWLVISPALVPLLIYAFALMAIFPSLRGHFSLKEVSAATWGAIAFLSLIPWPVLWRRNKTRAIEEAALTKAYYENQAKEEAEAKRIALEQFQALTPESPLADWLEMTTNGNEYRDRAFEGIQKSPRAQADAEAMIAAGEKLPMKELPRLGVRATPGLIAAAGQFLRNHADSFPPAEENPRPFRAMHYFMEDYVRAMCWLIDQGYDCEAELAAYEAAAKRYPECPDHAPFYELLSKLRARRSVPPNAGANP